MSVKNFVLDLEQIQDDDTCGMKTWLSRFEGGRGIVRRADLLPASLVAETHTDLRMLAKMPDISPAALTRAAGQMFAGLTAEDRQDVKKMELLTRRAGWFAAFGLYVEPKIRATFDDLPIDEELILDHDPLWIITRPDRLLRDKVTQETVYREYVVMPPGLLMKQWLQQWLYNIRLHAGMVAVSQWPRDAVLPHHGQIMGLSTGYQSTVNGRLVHPYVWGYHDKN